MAQQAVVVQGRSALNKTTAPVSVDVGGTEKWLNTGREYVEVTNGSGSAITLTFTIQSKIDGQSVANLTVSVPAGDVVSVGPFPTAWYNDAQGNCNMSYSATSSVKVLVVQMIPGN